MAWKTAFPDALCPPRGLTAIFGSGGKTSLMLALCALLRRTGTVIVSTSTHIYPPPGIACAQEEAEIMRILPAQGAVCVAQAAAESGKLCAPPIAFSRLCALADYVLVEADGARGLPLKAHAPFEPAIPREAAWRILVLGASGFGRPIAEAAHRPERYAALCGCSPEDIVTPRRAARVVAAMPRYDALFVNQVETLEAAERARELAGLVAAPVFAGSLREGRFQCLS